MASDWHVVGRIGKHHVGLLGPEDTGVTLGPQGVAAKKAMLAQEPKVT